jgi:hypothetical protein
VYISVRMRWFRVGTRPLNLARSKAIQVAVERGNERGLVSGVGALAEQLDQDHDGMRCFAFEPAHCQREIFSC